MSLLMKALEKAAKDREDADAARETTAPTGAATAPVAHTASTEFTLEPREPREPREPHLQSKPEAKPPEPAPIPVRPAAAAPPATASPEAALAATVIRAGGRTSGGGLAAAVAFTREQPLLVFGPLVALILIGYGTYIYLNMTSPRVATKPPPVQVAAPSTPIAPSPAPAAAGGGTAAEPKPPIPLAALLTQAQAIAAAGKPAPKPKPAAVVTAPAPDPVTAIAAAPTAVRDTIKVTTGGETPTVNPLLARAYEVFSAGDLVLAPQLYNRVLQNEPNNIDALLALASMATQQGDSNLASRHYLKVLEVEPRNALAQAGLIGMLGRADPLAAESRLKQLIAREPSAYLYFTLGNLYADQNRWPDAQQAYFQAHHLQAGNPDYAYNLAVGLEHVGQPKLALEYYRRTLQLVTAGGSANFSTTAVQERIVTLEKTVR